ncbi:hypothetical protein J6TS2_27340 [Heyndrickxia sporothermodurans]|nr:hypothetical protein J6TS2_27340 [Heyndrickxia sporothermodurans]
MKGLKFVGGLVLSVMLVSGFGVVQTQAATAHVSSYSHSVSKMKAKYAKQIKAYHKTITSNTSSINKIKKDLNEYKKLGKTKYDKTLSSLEKKVVKKSKTNASLSSKVSKFEKDVRAQKNTRKDNTLAKTSSSLKKQLVKLKTEIGKTKSEVASIGKKKKAEVELNIAKQFLTRLTDDQLEAVYSNKTTIQKLRNQINELLTTIPSKYDKELKKFDNKLVSLTKSYEDVKKQVLSLRKKIDNSTSTSSIAKLYHNDFEFIEAKFEKLLSILWEGTIDKLSDITTEVDKIGREREFSHYMKHYNEMNMLKEKLQLDSTADENDADDLRKLLHEKGVPFSELDPVAWSYLYKLKDYRELNYKEVQKANDRLQKLSTQEDDIAFATQLTLVNGLIDTFIKNRKAYAQKEKEAILAKYNGTSGK